MRFEKRSKRSGDYEVDEPSTLPYLLELLIGEGQWYRPDSNEPGSQEGSNY